MKIRNWIIIIFIVSILLFVGLYILNDHRDQSIYADSFDNAETFEIDCIDVDDLYTSDLYRLLNSSIKMTHFEVDDPDEFIEDYVITNEYYIGVYHTRGYTLDIYDVYYFLYNGYYYQLYYSEGSYFELKSVSTIFITYYMGPCVMPFIIDKEIYIEDGGGSYSLNGLEEFQSFNDIASFYENSNDDYYFINYDEEVIYLKGYLIQTDHKMTDDYIVKLSYDEDMILFEVIES